MASKTKIITIKKIVTQIIPQKKYSSDKYQEMVVMFFLLDENGHRYQYLGSSVEDSKVNKTMEMLYLAQVDEKIKIRVIQVKSGALDLERINKVIEVSEPIEDI